MPTNVETSNLGGYRASDQTHDYSYDSGVVVLPVAARTAGHRVIRLHGGVGKRIVKWRMSREGKPPIIPAYGDTSGDTIISARVIPAVPQSSATGQGYDWDVRGEYVYVQNEPRLAGTHAFPVGQHPFVDLAVNAQAVDVAGQLVPQYTGDTPFQTFIEAVADSITIDDTGNYQWPILGLPTVFSSDHILQD